MHDYYQDWIEREARDERRERRIEREERRLDRVAREDRYPSRAGGGDFLLPAEPERTIKEIVPAGLRHQSTKELTL